MSLQDLQSQRANFIAAYAQHKITKQQLDEALAYNQKQIDALKASSQQQAPVTQAQTATVPSQPVSAMPAEFPAQQFTDQSGTTWRNTNAPEELPERLQVIPTAMGPIPVKTFEAAAKDPTMQNIVIPAMEVAGIAALSAIPGAAPVVIGGAVAGVGLDIGIKSAVKSYESKELQLVLPGSVREVTDTALLSAGLSAVGGGAVNAIGKAAPVLAGQAANPIIKGATRVAVNAGLGGGVSGVASGGDAKAILEGAAFGAGLGVVGEVAGPAVSKAGGLISKTGTGKAAINAISNIKENVVGTKFTEITGARELAVQTTQGKTTTIKQITEPTTQTVTLRGKDAAFYKETNLSTLRNPKIEFAGTEKVYTPDSITGGKTVEPIPTLRQVESTRTATPVFEALKGNTDYNLGIVKTGKAGNFLETPSDLPALQRTKVGIRTDKGQPNAIVSEKTVVTTKAAILPETKISVRDYSGVKIRGTPDAQIYADPAKALPTNISQDIYKKLGGNYRPIADFGKTSKNTSGAMKPGSNEFFKDSSLTRGKGSNAAKTPEIKVVEKAQVVNKDVSLPRAIVGPAKPSVASRGSAWTSPVGTISIWNRQRQTQPEIIEEISISYPKDSPLQSPNTISEISTTQQGKQNDGLTPINVIPVPTRTDDWSSPKPLPIPVVPDLVKPAPPSVIPIPIPVPPRTGDWSIPVVPGPVKPEPPSVIPIPIPVPPDTKDEIDTGPIPIEVPDITQEVTPDMTTVITPNIPGKPPIFTPRTFTLNKRTMPPPIIPFTRGGGESAARGFKNFWGAAGLRKQAIPTPKELIEQVGLGKTRFKAKSLVATGNKFFAKPTKSKGKSRSKPTKSKGKSRRKR